MKIEFELSVLRRLIDFFSRSIKIRSCRNKKKKEREKMSFRRVKVLVFISEKIMRKRVFCLSFVQCEDFITKIDLTLIDRENNEGQFRRLIMFITKIFISIRC